MRLLADLVHLYDCLRDKGPIESQLISIETDSTVNKINATVCVDGSVCLYFSTLGRITKAAKCDTKSHTKPKAAKVSDTVSFAQGESCPEPESN